jgi:hypothetical protein
MVLGIRKAGIFKELYKIEEEVIRERATGKFKEHIKLRKRLEYRGRTVGDSGQNRGSTGAELWSV